MTCGLGPVDRTSTSVNDKREVDGAPEHRVELLKAGGNTPVLLCDIRANHLFS